jgi:eukaryotic-like serine/threonine-protein kinase
MGSAAGPGKRLMGTSGIIWYDGGPGSEGSARVRETPVMGQANLPRRSQSVPQGTQLNNMFEIERLLAAGGMGEVYRGRNIETGDPVAIKLVLPEFAQDEMILELFRKEARVLNHLYHEAIVRYYVFSVDKALGRPFLVMEFVDGYPLSQHLKSGPVPADSVVALKNRLAKGLHQTHEAGVIHRDIAPDNILLPEGRVDRAKIIDFGIARSVTAGTTLLGGSFAGKYNFVSPEQLGLFGGHVTHLSDMYSLGLVLAACLRGSPLDMSGTQLEVIEKRREVPDLSGIDPNFQDLLEAMLQPDPNQRPQSMAEVADWPNSPHREAPSKSVKIVPKTASATAVQPSTPIPGQASASQTASAGPQRPTRKLVTRPRAAVVLTLCLLAVLVGGLGGMDYWMDYWYGTEPAVQNIVEGRPSGPVATIPDEQQVPAPGPAPSVPQLVPSASPVPPSQPMSPLNRNEVVTYLREYPGGDCFFASPAEVRDTRVFIVGLGREEAFRRLLSDFKNSFGVEPHIHLQVVSDDQCVIVGAVAQLFSESINPPALELDRDIVRTGQILSGTVSEFGDAFVEILVIDNQGLVQRLDHESSGRRMNFRVQLEGVVSQPQPQLVVSIVSNKPLLSLRQTWPRGYIPARQLVPELLSEVSRSRADVAAAVRYFTFGG